MLLAASVLLVAVVLAAVAAPRVADSGDDGDERLRVVRGQLTLEESGYPSPHLHHRADPDVLDDVRSCRLTGPGIDLEGRAPGGVSAAAR